MTLHGLWPSLLSGKLLGDCNSGENIFVKIADQRLLESMKNHWPSLTGPDDKFWNHEYNKHGLCYTHKFKTEGFIPFFSLAMDMFSKQNLANMISELIENSSEAEIQIKTEDLRAIIIKKYPNIYFDFDCKKVGSKSYLSEIRIYYDLNLNSFIPPKGRTNCPASQNIFIGKNIQ